MLEISSVENSLIKDLKKLKDKKYRQKNKMFIAEGYKFLDYTDNICYILIREDISTNKSILEKIKNINCEKIKLTEKVYKSLSSQVNSQGIIVVYSKKDYNNNLSNNIVVLDEITDPGNLGTIIRIIDAVGIKDLILTENSVDVYNEKVIRSTMGSIFSANIIYMSKKELINYLLANNYNVITTKLIDKSVSYTDMKISDKNAFVFGNESRGVSDELSYISSQNIVIPIYGNAESLNVSVAAAIILYKFREIKKG